METTFIYVLKEPNTGDIRYVGKTNDPEYRLRKHCDRAKNRSNYRECWIFSLAQKGQKPALEIIDEVPIEHWQQWEIAWIEYFKECGCNLVNATVGGDGGHGLSPGIRNKISQSLLGRRPSEEARKNMSAAHKGHLHSESTLVKMSAIKTGNRNPFFGKNHSEVTRSKISAIHKGRKQSSRQIEARVSSLMLKGEDRHKQILSLVSEGKSQRQIAELLGVCQAAISTFLSRRKTQDA